MTPRTFLLLLLPITLLLAGCGKPKVDTSTDQRMRESLEKVRASLPEARRSEFDESLKTLALAKVDGLGDLFALAQTGALEQQAKAQLAGKTALEIIAEAHRVEAEKLERQKKAEEQRKQQEREARLAELTTLRAKLDAESPELLSKFVVERARFGKTTAGFMRENSIELAVRNGTGKAVSRAYFQAVLLTPGREIPWVDSSFNYSIAGGLEAGEAAVWKLTPNMFGDWAKAPERNDTIFIVQPVRLDGANGKCFTGERLSEAEAHRLLDLMALVDYDQAPEVTAKLEARTKAEADWRKTAVEASAKSERDLLLKQQADAEAAKAEIAKFAVEKASFYFVQDGFINKPVIDVVVRNNTAQPVTRFYARGVITIPDRATPLLDEEFNYTVKGGLKPGEIQNLKLCPNMFSEWGKVARDRALTLTVKIQRLGGLDEKPLFESEFTEQAAARLAALQKVIEQQGWK